MEDDFEKAIKTIDELEHAYYNGPGTYKKRQDKFLYECYGNWAIKNIRIYVLSHMDQSPIDSIEEFRIKMNDYACETKDSEMNFAFSVACDVAVDVIDCLIVTLRK